MERIVSCIYFYQQFEPYRGVWKVKFFVNILDILKGADFNGLNLSKVVNNGIICIISRNRAPVASYDAVDSRDFN